MAKPVLQSPKNPHFFQPLLPSFEPHLEIPVKFFSKHIEGRSVRNTAELRSDACEKTWKVEMDGRRLTVGWKEFAGAHDFRIGDIIVFRHEGDLVFHVTGLGPSCCEIQYVQEKIGSLPTKQNVKTEPESSSDVKDNMGKFPRKKHAKKRNLEAEAEAESFSSQSKCVFTEDSSKEKKRKTGESSQSRVSSALSENRFVTLLVTPTSLKRSRLYLPMSFTRVHEMEKAAGKEITMLDNHRVEWPVYLCNEKRYTRLRFGLGLKEFFKAIGIKPNESFVLELVWEDKTNPPILKFCSKITT